ncbi:MAG: ClpXP protease specificity-enhancing factor [Nevskiaceae bacterium]|nr:MAG: ClpXP protease specificity-enhancing factor [Nevskiaceae bacterium]TBR73748.1 MAG: ClpXP protease specificity-enhancing factor [Nevskiaceae bacterium]
MGSRRPYLIRAIYDWALDNNLTPHLLVAADQPGVSVPQAFVRDGKIALNIAPVAIRDLDLEHDPLSFSARFGGRSQDVFVPSAAVLAIYAVENGEGIGFGGPEGAEAPEPPPNGGSTAPPSTPAAGEGPPRPHGRPTLRRVK